MCTSGTDRASGAGPAARRFPGNERGSLLIGTLALLVMLSAFLIAASRGVVTDSDAATKHRWRTSAFYVSEAGLVYGLAKINADSSWTGLATPGKNCQEGSFSVDVSRNDEYGFALPSNQKRLTSTGTVYGAQAVTSLLVQS